MSRWIWIGGIAVVITAVVIYSALQATRVPVQTAEVGTGEIEVFIDERGKTRLPKIYEITMPFHGRIEEVSLDVGDQISAQQPLAHVSREDLASEVAQAQAVVDRLDAAIAQNDDTRLEKDALEQSRRFVESMAFTEEAAIERVEASRFRMNYTETILGRLQKLLDDNATSEDNVDAAQLRFDEARKGFTQDNLVYRATSAIRSATDMLPNMVQTYIDKKSLSRAVLEKQRNEAAAQLNDALTRQRRGIMPSPVDGVVLERDFFAEQFLNAGTRLMMIGNMNELEVETDILSQDVVRIRPGDRVEIYGPATGTEAGEGFSGEVKRVHPAGFSKLSTLGVEQQRVKVVISISDVDRTRLLDEGLGVDYRVRVRIFTDQKSDAIVVPRIALFRSPEGQWQTFVIRRGRLRLANVEVGLINERSAEILGGVEKGERVVVAPESRFQDGMRVRDVSP